MKSLLTTLIFLSSLPLFAQTYPLQGSQNLHLEAEMSAVDIVTGSGPDVVITHTLFLDSVDRSDLCQLGTVYADGTLTIRELEPTLETIVAAQKGRNRALKNVRLNGNHNNTSRARLRLEVPAGVTVSLRSNYGNITVADVSGLKKVRSTYGTIEVRNAKITSDIDLKSEYGAVDLALPAAQKSSVELLTNYGNLLTDLDLAIDTEKSFEGDYRQKIIGNVNGGGLRVRCESPYGNVYLRKLAL